MVKQSGCGQTVTHPLPQVTHLWISALNQRESCMYSGFWFVYLCQLCLIAFEVICAEQAALIKKEKKKIITLFDTNIRVHVQW